MLGQLETETEIVVADFEAGLGTLTRLKPGHLHVLIVVTEPTAKAADVARRALGMIRDGELGRPVVIANRVRSREDLAVLETELQGEPLAVIPDDPAIRAADLRGVAAYDTAFESPAVRTLRTLAETLTTAPHG